MSWKGRAEFKTNQVKEGDKVEIIGNVVFISEPYGLVVKKCELIGTVK